MITIDNLADAIYKAENSVNHPYGIIQKFHHTTPRQACINTIINTQRVYHITKIDRTFIYLLADKYCPPECDKVGNLNWKHNVVRILHLD